MDKEEFRGFRELEDESFFPPLTLIVRIPLDRLQRIPSRQGAEVEHGCSDSPKLTTKLSDELVTVTAEPIMTIDREPGIVLDRPRRTILTNRKYFNYVTTKNPAQQQVQLVVKKKKELTQAVSIGDSTSNISGTK